MTVAALFCTATGPYRRLGCEVFDASRDARTFDLSCPVVAHPPCRSWGKLRGMAKPRKDERDLAIFAMWAVRHCGGVLEHPVSSGLWSFFGVEPGKRDHFGGLLVPMHQSAFGHRAPKLSGFYFVGAAPFFPDTLTPYASGRVASMCTQERERTPLELARRLVNAAESCNA